MDSNANDSVTRIVILEHGRLNLQDRSDKT